MKGCPDAKEKATEDLNDTLRVKLVHFCIFPKLNASTMGFSAKYFIYNFSLLLAFFTEYAKQRILFVFS